jgi:hypothetical protein
VRTKAQCQNTLLPWNETLHKFILTIDFLWGNLEQFTKLKNFKRTSNLRIFGEWKSILPFYATNASKTIFPQSGFILLRFLLAPLYPHLSSAQGKGKTVYY